jgi:hypothetical protein
MVPRELAGAPELAPRSGPARRAAPLALPGCSWWPGDLVELRAATGLLLTGRFMVRVHARELGPH